MGYNTFVFCKIGIEVEWARFTYTQGNQTGMNASDHPHRDPLHVFFLFKGEQVGTWQ